LIIHHINQIIKSPSLINKMITMAERAEIVSKIPVYDLSYNWSRELGRLRNELKNHQIVHVINKGSLTTSAFSFQEILAENPQYVLVELCKNPSINHAIYRTETGTDIDSQRTLLETKYKLASLQEVSNIN